MTDQILELLLAERDKLDRAIIALQPVARRGRPPKQDNMPVWVRHNGAKALEQEPATQPAPHKQRTAAQRKRQALSMKKYWKAKKAAAKA